MNSGQAQATILLIIIAPFAAVGAIAGLAFLLSLILPSPVKNGDVLYDHNRHEVYVVDYTGLVSDSSGAGGRGSSGHVVAISLNGSSDRFNRPVSLGFTYPHWQMRWELRRGKMTRLARHRDPNQALVAVKQWFATGQDNDLANLHLS